MVGNIQNPDYETVSAVCEHCGSLCVFNRIDDIDEPGPYHGRYVTCYICREQFWIYGDIINPAHELLISSAREYFQTRRYMQCVAILGQAWEIFFSLFAYSNYLYRPFFANPELDHSAEHFNRLSLQLYNATRKHSFNPLRNVLINTVLNSVHPPTLQESAADISRIRNENFGGNPKMADVVKFPDEEVRDLLTQLQQLTIADLRNKVVHQHAYRPRRVEVEKCLKGEIDVLYCAKHLLPVYTFDLWRFKSGQRRRG